MSYGRIYTWTITPDSEFGGHVTVTIAPLLHLDTSEEGKERLRGRYVRIRNGGAVNELDQATGMIRPVSLGNAQPNPEGNFLFEPGQGGGRIDKVVLAGPDLQWRYIQASHFGEVNTYFHLDRIAAYVDTLLHELEARPLPCVSAVVNAHHAATAMDGIRDGVRRVDLLILKTLLLLGRLNYVPERALKHIHRKRESFAVGLRILLQADELLYAGRHRDLILAIFARRDIQPIYNVGTDTNTETCFDTYTHRVRYDGQQNDR